MTKQYEYKIIRYKYIVQNDPVVPIDLVQDKSVNMTEEEFKHLTYSYPSISNCSLCNDVQKKLKGLL